MEHISTGEASIHRYRVTYHPREERHVFWVNQRPPGRRCLLLILLKTGATYIVHVLEIVRKLTQSTVLENIGTGVSGSRSCIIAHLGYPFWCKEIYYRQPHPCRGFQPVVNSCQKWRYPGDNLWANTSAWWRIESIRWVDSSERYSSKSQIETRPPTYLLVIINKR
jgi:hypothetical protein